MHHLPLKAAPDIPMQSLSSRVNKTPQMQCLSPDNEDRGDSISKAFKPMSISCLASTGLDTPVVNVAAVVFCCLSQGVVATQKPLLTQGYFTSLLCAGDSGVVSGSADHDIKFWEWQVMEEEGSGLRQLSLAHTRTLKMTDDVLCIRISPDGKQSETQQLFGVCFVSRRVGLQGSLFQG